MKRYLLTSVFIGVVLFLLSYTILFILIRIYPEFVSYYYNPDYYPGSTRTNLFFLHPFILSFSLGYFWYRFKAHFTGSPLLRGIRFGFTYLVIASIPSMWITFSSLNVTPSMVMSWLAYGLFQAIVVGYINALMNP